MNMVLAPFMLHEKLTFADVVATVIMLAGTVTCITFGSKSTKTYNVSDRKGVCYLTIMCAAMYS